MKNTQYLGYFLYKMKITIVAIEHPNNLMRLFVEISKKALKNSPNLKKWKVITVTIQAILILANKMQ